MLDEPRIRPTIVLVLSSTVIYFVYVSNNEDINRVIFCLTKSSQRSPCPAQTCLRSSRAVQRHVKLSIYPTRAETSDLLHLISTLYDTVYIRKRAGDVTSMRFIIVRFEQSALTRPYKY